MYSLSKCMCWLLITAALVGGCRPKPLVASRAEGWVFVQRNCVDSLSISNFYDDFEINIEVMDANRPLDKVGEIYFTFRMQPLIEGEFKKFDLDCALGMDYSAFEQEFQLPENSLSRKHEWLTVGVSMVEGIFSRAIFFFKSGKVYKVSSNQILR